MCGRAYETYSDEELYFRYLSKRPLTPLVLSPIYNLCPTQNSPVLRLVAGERQFDQMRWQLVPTTEPAFTTKLSTINARSETVFSRPLYRNIVELVTSSVIVVIFFKQQEAAPIPKHLATFRE